MIKGIVQDIDQLISRSKIHKISKKNKQVKYSAAVSENKMNQKNSTFLIPSQGILEPVRNENVRTQKVEPLAPVW